MRVGSILGSGFWMLIIFASCEKPATNIKERQTESINPALNFQPNIVWIVAEDMSPNIAAFGDSTVNTPVLNELAKEGVCYDNFYSPAPVCAPARSAIITGMYPVSLGTHNMRTGPWYAGIPPEEQIERYEKFTPEDIIAYEAVPAPEVKLFTEFLRKSGYYTSNNAKEDYQFLKTPTAWDDCSKTAHWRNREPGQPFFSVFNLMVTHESQIWQKASDSLWVDEQLEVPVPPYLPDTKVARQDIRRMYSNIVEMDTQVGVILSQLEADGLLDSTIIVWYTDHGGPLPRQKRSLHDSGIKVPMIIRYPNQKYASLRDSSLLSFVDLAPTTLSLAGIKPPDYMQGKSFLGEYQSTEKAEYIFAAADRFDKFYDQSRAVRDDRYKYIKHYNTDQPIFMPIDYREHMNIMRELNRLREIDSLTDVQSIWFNPTKPKEQLYDTKVDPHEIHNIAGDPAYRDKVLELRAANNLFIKEVNDLGFVPERTLINRFWPNGVQPKTSDPQVGGNSRSVSINNDTKGASIGYRVLNNELAPNEAWQLYAGKLELQLGDSVVVIAHRLGYQPSKEVTFVMEENGPEIILK